MQEAILGGTPFSNRLLFVTILLHCIPSDPLALFNEFWESMLGRNWTRERLLRFLARKMQLNNAPLDVQLFAEIDVTNINDQGDDLECDEGAQINNPPQMGAVQGHKEGLQLINLTNQCYNVLFRNVRQTER